LCDQDPIIDDGRVLVPLRQIVESLGASVNWDPGTETVTAQKSNVKLVLQVGKRVAYCNEQSIDIDAAPILKNGRVLVPARLISESFGAVVNWDNTNRKVNIAY